MSEKPRVLFVSRERHRLPLSDVQRRKWDAIGERLDLRVLAAAQPGSPTRDERFRLAPAAPALDGVLYYLRLPGRIRRELRSFAPDAAVVQGVHEMAAFLLARAAARSRAKAILEIHGDWRIVTRLYGSKLRRLLSPLNDVLGPLVVRRADGIRAISRDAARLVRDAGREPTAVFPAYIDATAFTRRPPQPLPATPTALFVGALEATKNVDGLARAWTDVARRLPAARLRLVGDGTLRGLAERLVAEHGARWDRVLDAEGVAGALDESWLLVLPSRSEGLGRVLVEAACRGRALVGARRGGIPDVVEDGVNGLLVDPEDGGALADALVRVLGDRGEAERLGAAAQRTGEAWTVTPEQFAEQTARLVLDILAK